MRAVSRVRSFTCAPSSVTAARMFVREALSDKPAEMVEAIELMTSELATNCVRHAASDFEVLLSIDGKVTVEVRDHGEQHPQVAEKRGLSPSGHGLRIVDGIADEWGTSRSDGGNTVWFTLAPPV